MLSVSSNSRFCGVAPARSRAAKTFCDEVWLVELAGADVDGDRDVCRLRLIRPCRDLVAGRRQHPISQRQDQPGFLGQWNEVSRQQEAALRVVPSDQGLCADHARAFDLRLIKENELIGIDGMPQLGFHGGSNIHGGLQGGREEAQRVAALRFGLIHGDVGLLQNLIRAFSSISKNRNPDAGCSAAFAVANQVGLGNGSQHLFGAGLRLLGSTLSRFAQVLQHHHKLISHQSSHGVVLLNALSKPPSGLLKHQVACPMAERIVQCLKVVEVDQQQGMHEIAVSVRSQNLLHSI